MVLVFCALILTVLLGIAGFSLDLGNWYLHALRLQRSADAAALAGSVYLPNDFGAARAAALDNLARNNASHLNPVITQSASNPTMLKVSLSETVPTYFVGLVGVRPIDMDRTAVAEYRPYVPMGSPSNVLGTEPTNLPQWEKLTSRGMQSHYWLNISGGNTPKANGDRYSGGNCSQTADRCSSGPAVPDGNTDFSPEGQAYVVRVPEGVTGNLQIQAFDAGFAYVNDSCTQSTLNNANNFSPAGTNLYRSGNNEPACTGDQSTNTALPAPDTTYELFTPETSPGGSRRINTGGCTPRTFAGTKDNIAPLVNPGSAQYNATFTGWFRKWSTLCTITIGASNPAGDYVLKVSTNLNANGLNRFALRAAIMSTSTTVNQAQTSKISLFAKGRLVIYAHENTGNVEFFLARLNSATAGRDLTLTLFDIGDADGGASLSVVPPPDATNDGSPMTNFGNCTYTPPGSTTYKPTTSTCGINNMTSSVFNGRITNIRIPLPDEYRCNDSDVNGCWTRMRLTYGAGGVQDTTSWEVALNGNPLHLVTDPDFTEAP